MFHFVLSSPDYPANSNDSFCSSELSLDGSFEQMDDVTSDTFQNLTGDHHHPHHPRNSNSVNNNFPTNLNTHPSSSTTSSGSINPNPIDKLYLMQDSYFSGE